MYAKRQLTGLFENERQRNKMKFSVGDRQFLPKNQIIVIGGVEVECPIGMVANEDKDKCSKYSC